MGPMPQARRRREQLLAELCTPSAHPCLNEVAHAKAVWQGMLGLVRSAMGQVL